MALSRHCHQGNASLTYKRYLRDVGDSCALRPQRVFQLNVKLMHLKSGHAAPSFWVQPLSCGSDAGLRRSSRVRANASLNSSTGDDPPGSQRHTHSSEAAKHVARSEAVKESRNSISGTGMDVPGHSSAVDRLDSPHKPTADGPSYPVTVQVLGRLNKTVYKSDMEEAILDITYEVVDEGKKQARHQMLQRDSMMSGVEPGDPYEEGWVADTANDARARHWQTGESQYKPVSWSDLGLNFGSFDVVATVGGNGNDGKRTSGGSGDGGGSGYYPKTAYGDGGGSSAAVAIVYAFLVAVLGYFWWSIYIVVSKPELIGKKVSTFWSSQRWRAKVLQRNKEVKIAPRKETRYRTLCVYRQGYSRLARRLIAPSPAVDASLSDHTLERDGGFSSMFLEVPRPSISAHPVRLRRICSGPRLVNSRAQTSIARDLGPSLRLDVPLSLSPEAMQIRPSRSIAAEARHFSEEMHMMHSIGYTPFEDSAASGPLTAELSLHRACGSLPSSGTLDDILHSMPSNAYCAGGSSFRQRRLSWAGMSVHGTTPATAGSSHVCNRRATFGRFGELHDHSHSEEPDPQLTTDEYHDLQRHFVSHVVPGSLALNTLQRQSTQSRHEPSFPFEHAGRGEAASAMKRNKSQPALSVDEPRIPTHEPVRRSASLHSLVDGKSAIKSGEGMRSGSELNTASVRDE